MKDIMCIIKSGHEIDIKTEFNSTIDALFMLQELVGHVSEVTKVSGDLILELLQVGHGAYLINNPDAIKKTDEEVTIALWKELEHRIEASMRASEE